MKHACAHVLLATASLASCNFPQPDARFDAVLPERSTFVALAPVLAHTCGTLDCHGSRSRNLRLYGSEGLRLGVNDRPLLPPCTTPDEIDEDYESVVDLEPEVLSAVVSDRGAHPERLTLVRKARGLESHKGGTLFRAGDDADTCLTTWLGGQIRADVCARVVLGTSCPPRAEPGDASTEGD